MEKNVIFFMSFGHNLILNEIKSKVFVYTKIFWAMFEKQNQSDYKCNR